MRLSIHTAVIASLVLVFGCEKEEPTPETPLTPIADPSVAPAATAAPADTEEQPNPVLDGIPTPEDFEEEAAEDINAGNLEKELDKIEKELQE